MRARSANACDQISGEAFDELRRWSRAIIARDRPSSLIPRERGMPKSFCLTLAMSVLTAALAVSACGGGGPASSAPQAGTPAAPAAPTDTADGPGVITGATLFDGTAPPPRVVPMDSDPKCKPEPGANTSERLLVGPSNGLRNVFVYVKDGLGTRTYAIPTTPVTLDQKGCRYFPHVFGVQVGQPVSISNSDPALNNYTPFPRSTGSSTSRNRQGCRRPRASSPPPK